MHGYPVRIFSAASQSGTPDDSEKSSDKAAEVEIKDAEEEEDADEPENFEETMDAASESEE